MAIQGHVVVGVLELELDGALLVVEDAGEEVSPRHGAVTPTEPGEVGPSAPVVRPQEARPKPRTWRPQRKLAEGRAEVAVERGDGSHRARGDQAPRHG